MEMKGLTRFLFQFTLFCVVYCNWNVIERPVDSLAEVGKTVVLRCAVQTEDGQPLKLWWTKHGKVLSFDRDIPGLPRYTCIGDAAKGECHLQIKPVSLEDDDTFECQGQRHFRAAANLSVLVIPTNITLEGLRNGAVTELREGSTQQVTCAVLGGKPAAEISWFKNGIKLGGVKSSNHSHPDKTVDTRARLTFVANRTDHESVFTCRAEQAALPARSYISTNFTLSVLYPPEVPVITGYSNEAVIPAGERLNLVCEVVGGNPPPKVFWYKNDRLIDQTFHNNQPEVTQNDYVFTVNHEDDQAEYKCEAKNLATVGALSAVVKLKVHYPPSSVDIKGNLEARAGSSVPLACIAGPARPPARIQWIVNGKPEILTTVSLRDVPNSSGKVTVSNVTVQLEADVKRDISVICTAWNDERNPDNRKSKTATISVLYPPDSVAIYGQEQGHLKAGQQHLLTCVAEGGKPLATIHWFKGKRKRRRKKIKWKKITKGVSEPRVSDTSVQSELRFRVSASDNRAQYRCEARSRALEKPLTDVRNLSVYFAPKEVNVSISPGYLRAGKIATLMCISASGNPVPIISWWKDGIRQDGSTNVHEERAENFGFLVKNRLFVPLDPGVDGETFICRAQNTETRTHVSRAVSLEVNYKPIFAMESPQVISVLENETISVNVSARARPKKIDYRWRKTDSGELVLGVVRSSVSGLIGVGPVLSSASVKRIDAGTYLLSATNKEGTANFTVNINVRYAAEVSRVTSPVIVDIGEEARLECQVDANPHTPNMIKWERKDFDMSTVIVSFGANNSTLKLKSAEANSSGIFVCVADNGLGQPDRKEIHLLVRQAPTLDKSNVYRKAAGKLTGNGVIRCRATGAPSVSLLWYRDGKLLQNSHRVRATYRRSGLMIYESTVEISPVEDADYGSYLCAAENTLGKDILKIEFEKVGPPDLPENLKLINISGTAVTLGWKAGFDGGMPQSFQIKYRVLGKSQFQTVHVKPADATRYTISGLKPFTHYAFAVGARNRVGFSGYTDSEGDDALIVETRGSSGKDGKLKGVDKNGITIVDPWLILVICILGVTLFLLNICLLICCIRRRKRRKMQEKAASARLMDAPRPVQMYGAEATSGLRPDSQYTESDHHGHSEFSEDDASVRTVIEIDSNGQPVYKSASPVTYQTYLVDDPRAALMPLDYADFPSGAKYAEALRANSLQRRIATGHFSPSGGHPEQSLKAPLYPGETIEDPVPPPMGPLRTLSEELNQYAPYSQYTPPVRNGLLRTYSPNNTLSPVTACSTSVITHDAIPTVVQSAGATPYAEVRPMIAAVNGGNGSGSGYKQSSGSLGRSGGSPVLTTFSGGYPQRQKQEYLDMDQLSGDLV